MIKVHHLKSSRGQRILWLLEEIGVPYEVARYYRDPKTGFSPPALRAVHYLGKSPVVNDDALTIAESGAIIEYLCGRYKPEMAVDRTSPSWPRYLECMHYPEGSAMLYVALLFVVGRFGWLGRLIKSKIEREVLLQVGYMSHLLGDAEWFVDRRFTAADVMMVPVVIACAEKGLLGGAPNLVAYLDRIQALPAWQRAMANGDLHPQLA